MNNSIFRPYDIRGEYPQEIDEKTTEEIAAKTGKFLKIPGQNGKFVIGMDVRKSSPALYKAVVSGLLKAGIKKSRMILAEKISTPMLYFLCAYFKADGGFMITSSHGPKNTNGIKPIGNKVSFISGEDIKKIILKK